MAYIMATANESWSFKKLKAVVSPVNLWGDS